MLHNVTISMFGPHEMANLVRKLVLVANHSLEEVGTRNMRQKIC